MATIPCRWRTTISYSHSFGISQNYVVYIDQPLFMAGVKLLTAHVKGHCMIDCMEWKPEEKVRCFYVLLLVQYSLLCVFLKLYKSKIWVLLGLSHIRLRISYLLYFLVFSLAILSKRRYCFRADFRPFWGAKKVFYQAFIVCLRYSKNAQ